MENKKLLFISGSLGLGHATRDLAIAAQLRRQNPDLTIHWLAGPPAAPLIQAQGEQLLPQCERFTNLSLDAERVSRGFRLNLIRYAAQARSSWSTNVRAFLDVVGSHSYDVVVGDETYEIDIALERQPAVKTFPFVMIYDFVGMDAMSWNPIERAMVYVWNRIWARPEVADLALFVGEPEDVPDKKFGWGLPNRRTWARARYKFTGYVFPFELGACSNRDQTRAELGYGPEPLIVCSIGGTSIGRELLELCGQAFAHLRQRLPSARMVLVCGPRLDPATVKVPPGVEVHGYVPALYRHFAACDLAIVQAGGTSTLELTALRRPFLYFPIEGHCEQELGVAERLARHRAGERLLFSRTSPQLLAERALANLGKKVNYAPIRTDGGRQAARLISELFD